VDRGQLLARLEKAWRQFQESYAGLSDSQLLKPGVTGDWSVRDILAHVTTCEQEALKHLPTILKGGKPPRYSVAHGGINAFNRKMTEQKRSLHSAKFYKTSTTLIAVSSLSSKACQRISSARKRYSAIVCGSIRTVTIPNMRMQ
jgi:hypothetical protein